MRNMWETISKPKRKIHPKLREQRQQTTRTEDVSRNTCPNNRCAYKWIIQNNYRRTYSTTSAKDTYYVNSIAWPTVLGKKELKWHTQESRGKTLHAYAKA